MSHSASSVVRGFPAGESGSFWHSGLVPLRRPRRAALAALAAVGLLGAEGIAQVQLVRDLQPGVLNSTANGAPTQIRSAGNRAFFVASSFLGGPEPHVTDGTAAGTRPIGDFRPGFLGSRATFLAASAGEALYVVRPADGLLEFVRTDGTPAGTQRLGNLGLPDGLFLAARLPNGHYVIQYATTNVYAPVATYVSDLTAAGTQLAPGLTGFAFLFERQGLAYGFGAVSPGAVGTSLGYDLCVTDGTVGGSHVVATHVVRSPQRPSQTGVVEFAGRLYFLRAQPGRIELGSTDGTVAGTVNHGAIAGLSTTLQLQGNSPLVAFASGLAFVANGDLWTSDGTAAGTAEVPNMPCHTLSQMVVHLGRMYFSGVGSQVATGFELWSSDGTAAGTSLVQDLRPGAANGSPTTLVASAQGIWFSATPTSTGTHLCLCTGPQSLQVIGPTTQGLGAPIVPFGGGVLLSEQHPTAGLELHFATPQQPPTLVVDLNRTLAGQDRTAAVRLRDRLLFFADDGVTGRELWSSDGTAAGTTVLDRTPGPGSTSQFSTGERFVAFGSRVAVAVRNTLDTTVLVSDGTLPGTATLPLPASQLGYSLAVRDGILFACSGDQVFRSDGTANGTYALPARPPVNLFQPQLYALPNALAMTGVGQPMLGTDGLAAPVVLANLPVTTVLGIVAGRLVYGDAQGLRATDGTVAGTQLLHPATVQTAELEPFGDAVHFADAGHLYRTNGTVQGTVVLAALPGGATANQIVRTARGLFVALSEPATGTELWRYDAATSQLVLVRDLQPGPLSGLVEVRRLGDGDDLLLSVADPLLGIEPWTSDGTANGTAPLGEINPGPNGSNPQLLGIAGGNAYLLAADDQVGNELRALPLRAVGASSVQPIAAGCAGAAGSPMLDVLAAPQLGAAGFGHRASALVPSTLAALAIGTQLGNTAYQGCEIAPHGAVATQVAVASVGGSATFALPVPAAPSLLGLQLTSQAFALDAGTPRGFAASNALQCVCGD